MPDFDVNTPSPDAGHEAIRVAVVNAIEELGYNTADVGSSFDLVDLLFAYIDDLLASHDAQRIRIDALNIRCDTALANTDTLQRQVADLTRRLTALEPSRLLSGPDAAG